MATDLATRDAAPRPEASPRQVAKYLTALKPILTHAADVRNVWVRYLATLGRRDDLDVAHTEAVQFALARGQQFHDARRKVAQIQPPAGYEAMHHSIDGWLGGLLASCEVIVRAKPPLTAEVLDRVRQVLHEAGQKADKFNAQRAVAVQTIVEAAQPVPDKAKRVVANKKELRALLVALVAALLLIAGGAYALSTLSAAPPVTRTPTASGKGLNGPTTQTLRYTQQQILDRLKQEIAARKVAWLEPDVQLAQPNRIVVTGKISGPTSVIPVKAVLEVLVTDDGKPQL